MILWSSGIATKKYPGARARVCVFTSFYRKVSIFMLICGSTSSSQIRATARHGWEMRICGLVVGDEDWGEREVRSAIKLLDEIPPPLLTPLQVRLPVVLCAICCRSAARTDHPESEERYIDSQVHWQKEVINIQLCKVAAFRRIIRHAVWRSDR